MQPYVFPYLGYFQLIAAVDKFILLDDVHYINKGWINRNRLLFNQAIISFIIPLKKASQNKLISELEISYEVRWQPKLLKMITAAYAKAPYFETVFPLIEQLIANFDVRISELAYRSLLAVSEYLGLATKLEASSVGYANGHLRAQYKILDICQQEHATEYINPRGGAALYDQALFEQQGVRLLFLAPTLSAYPQFSADFVPGLSILDVMMHNAPAQIRQLIGQYQLV